MTLGTMLNRQNKTDNYLYSVPTEIYSGITQFPCVSTELVLSTVSRAVKQKQMNVGIIQYH